MKIIIALVVLVGVMVMVFFYSLFGGSSKTEQLAGDTLMPKMESEEVIESEPREFKGETTFATIQALGENLECRISYLPPDQIDAMTGTYFVSDGRVRGDFEMNAPDLGDEVVSSIIMDGTQFYSWSRIDGQAYGIKADNSNIEIADSELVRQPVPNDAQVSYECVEWKNVDASIFVPPSDILFQDMNNLFRAGMEYGTVYGEGEF